MVNRKWRVAGVLLTISALMLTACGGKSQPSGGTDQGGSSAEPKELVLACYAGDIEKYYREAILPEFEKQYNVKVSYLPGVSTETIAKLQAQKSSPQIDVACLDDGPQYQANAMGLLDATEPSKMPNLVDVYDVAKMKDNVGVGWALFGVGIAYNPAALEKAKLPAPESWNDLAKPEYKGKVVVDSISTTYGLDLLIMLARANGGGEQNIDPGFAKMKEIVPNVVTFDTTADLSPFFQQEEAWIGVWTDSEANAYAKKAGNLKFVYPKEGAPALMATASVVKNAPHKDLAEKFLNHLVGKEAQNAVGMKIGFGPVNKKVELPAEMAALVTYGPEAASRLIQVDWKTINEKRPEWSERWSKEIEQK